MRSALPGNGLAAAAASLPPPPPLAAAQATNTASAMQEPPYRPAMAGVVRGVLGLPLRLVRAPVGFIVLLVGAQRRRTFGLPVAGLSEHRAQPVHFTLKRAASNREVGAGWGDGASEEAWKRAPAWGARRWAAGMPAHAYGTRLGLACHTSQPTSTWLQEQAVADRWLEALAVCQVAAGLLLR